MLRTPPPASLLIVDDDVSLLRLVQKVLTSSFPALTITAMTDPREAARYLDESICDILLSDIDMPGITGLELLQRAKQRNAWTQVIFMTGQSTWSRVSEAMGNGASDYLLKPVDRSELEKVISEAIVRIQRWQYALRKSQRQREESEPRATIAS